MTTMAKNNSLKDLFSKAKWTEIPARFIRINMEIIKNIVSISYQDLSKKTASFRINIRIGTNIIKNLGWKINNKIIIFQDIDDVFLFKLIKSDNKVGYQLKKVNQSNNTGLISFSWRSNVPLEAKSNTVVPHEVFNKNILVFRGAI